MTFCKIRQSFIENFQIKNKLYICYKHYCRRVSICQKQDCMPERYSQFAKNKIVCQNAKNQIVSICQKQNCLPEYMSIAKTRKDAEIKKFFQKGVK